MRTLSIDIETYCSVDLTKSGVYPYAESPDFEILLFAYAFDDEPVQLIDLTIDELPADIIDALTDPDIIKTAFNANFERVCLSAFLKCPLIISQWECTAVRSLMLGLPASLENTAKVLKLDTQKMAGGSLIRYFTKPCRPTAANGGRIRNLPRHNYEKWAQFCRYCMQDVEVEREIRRKTAFYNIPEFEQKLWHLDQKINDRGVLIDSSMADHAIACDAYMTEMLTARAKELTGLGNPNSVTQLKNWLEDKSGKHINSLDKENVRSLLDSADDTEIREVLGLRIKMAKTSVKKYIAMKNAVCADNRIRGLLQYYGANRTGRWAGRTVQIHNLPQNKIPDLDLAREILKSGDYEWLDIMYGNTSDVLSQLIRTAFTASPGKKLIVADFSSIEARIIAWMADEQWRLDVFNTHGKIYEASASQMFNVPVEAVTKGSLLRQKGKIAELALGYGGSTGALISMGALKMGLSEDELPELVSAWRTANPGIVRLWKAVNDAACRAVESKTTVKLRHNIVFSCQKGILFIQLPSGRKLSYLKAETVTGGRFNNQVISYEGTDQTSKKWRKIETYGAKLVENIVQAAARDCLAESLTALDEEGYDIVAHVHDEVIIDAPMDKDVASVNSIMSRRLPWAPGLPLKAEGYETGYYRKD